MEGIHSVTLILQMKNDRNSSCVTNEKEAHHWREKFTTDSFLPSVQVGVHFGLSAVESYKTFDAGKQFL